MSSASFTPGMLPPALAAAMVPQPIHPDAELLKLCQQHLTNRQAFNECPLDSDDSPHWPPYERTYAAVNAAKPITLAGAAAKGKVILQEEEDECGPEHEGGAGHDAWMALADLVRIADWATVAEIASSPDAELLALCREFDALERFRIESFPDGARAAASEAELDERLAQITEKQTELGEQIIAIKPRTIEGLRALARSIALWAPDMLNDEYSELSGLHGMLNSALLRALVGGAS